MTSQGLLSPEVIDAYRRDGVVVLRGVLDDRWLARLAEAGITTQVFCMPILPGINSSEGRLRPIFEAAVESGAQDVVASNDIQEEMLEEAQECLSAKQELAASQTDAEFDRAIMKVEILCNT